MTPPAPTAPPGAEERLPLAVRGARFFASLQSAPQRADGLAYGFEGWAWALGRLVTAGLLPPPPEAVLDAVHLRLARPWAANEAEGSAALRGPLGRLLAAMALAPLEARFGALVKAFVAELGALADDGVPDLWRGALGTISTLCSLEEHGVKLPAGIGRRWHGVGRELAASLAATTPDEGVFLGLLHGIAGALAVLERLHHRRPFPELARLRTHGVALLAGATRSVGPDRRAWPITTTEDELTFFATCSGPPGIVAGLAAARRWSGSRGYDRALALGLRMCLDPRVRAAYRPAAALCCGRLGEAHALAAIGKMLGRPELIARARRTHRATSRVAVRAEAQAAETQRSLFGDELGWLYVGFHVRHPDRLPYVPLC